jgi:hypothetical protein
MLSVIDLTDDHMRQDGSITDAPTNIGEDAREAPEHVDECQSALNFDPRSASNFDPLSQQDAGRPGSAQPGIAATKRRLWRSITGVALRAREIA